MRLHRAPDPARDRARVDPARDHRAHHARLRRSTSRTRTTSARRAPRASSPHIVDRRHVIRNALLPITTIIGLQVGLLLSGAVLTETVFAWPGIGSWLVDAIANRDYPVLQGGILFLAIVFVFVNLIVDISYAFINPRIRLELMSVAEIEGRQVLEPRPRRASGATPGAGCAATRARSSGFILVGFFLDPGDLRAADRAVRPARGRRAAHRRVRAPVARPLVGPRPAVARRVLADRLRRALLARDRHRLGHRRPLDRARPRRDRRLLRRHDRLRDHALHGRDARDPGPAARDRRSSPCSARASSRS